MSEERKHIVAYLRRVAATEVGTVLSPQSREIVDWCASWIENNLDAQWEEGTCVTGAHPFAPPICAQPHAPRKNDVPPR